jgi:U6 snRNA-associated Sm-like protein LSm4
MLPLSLLKAAENHPMSIELKNGDTYNGRLVSCNVFMNICLKDVICTSKVSKMDFLFYSETFFTVTCYL